MIIDIPESAHSLALRLINQRDKWISSVSQTLGNHVLTSEKPTINIINPSTVVGTFQLEHVMSFIAVNKYVKESQMGEFTINLTQSLIKEPYESWKETCSRYEVHKQKDFQEPLSYFCEDVAMAILGSYSGMLYGPAFLSMANDFLHRNWGITADHFGDEGMVVKCTKAVEAIQNSSRI